MAIGGEYGPVGEASKKIFGKKQERGWVDGTFVECWGDFNNIKFLGKRLGCRVISKAMEEFLEFIDTHYLIDLPVIGAYFTWSKSKSRLDRFLVSTSWEESTPGVIQALLLRLTSDHFPVLLEGSRGNRKRSPLRFENIWLKASDFEGGGVVE